jgi:hypothetical protein
VGQSDFLEGLNQTSFLSGCERRQELQQAHPDREKSYVSILHAKERFEFAALQYAQCSVEAARDCD